MTSTPHQATPWMLATLLFGQKVVGGNITISVLDMELGRCSDAAVFCPMHQGLSRTQALLLDEQESMVEEPVHGVLADIPSSELNVVQLVMTARMRHQEDQKFGRSVVALVDPEGGSGKSTLARHMVQREHAMLLSPTDRNSAFHALQNCAQAQKRGPKMVIFDVPRAMATASGLMDTDHGTGFALLLCPLRLHCCWHQLQHVSHAFNSCCPIAFMRHAQA